MALDILKTGMELLGGGGATGMLGSLFDKVKGVGNPEVTQQAEGKKEFFKSFREGIFGEIGKSLLLREMPRLSQLTDLGLAVTGNMGEEKVAWQHEFEIATSLLLFVPNSWKHHVTDLIADNAIFKNIVKYWPGLDMNVPVIGGFLSKKLPILGQGGTIRDRILNQNPPDPDAVIQALRVIHQDVFVTGKMGFDKLKGSLGGTGAAATLLAGAGGLAAADKLLGGDSKPDASGAPATEGPLDSIKQTLGIDTGKNSGKKIAELISTNAAVEKTKMQKNLIKLLNQLGVLDQAILKKGNWNGNNDEVTVQIPVNGAWYYLIFDNDTTSTDIKVNNTQGVEIADFTDWGGLDTDDDAKKIIKAIQEHPSPAQLPQAALPSSSPAHDNAAQNNQKAA